MVSKEKRKKTSKSLATYNVLPDNLSPFLRETQWHTMFLYDFFIKYRVFAQSKWYPRKLGSHHIKWWLLSVGFFFFKATQTEKRVVIKNITGNQIAFI